MMPAHVNRQRIERPLGRKARQASYLARAPIKNSLGARDLSLRNPGTAGPCWEISRHLRQPTFLRTKVRVPFARATITLKRYQPSRLASALALAEDHSSRSRWRARGAGGTPALRSSLRPGRISVTSGSGSTPVLSSGAGCAALEDGGLAPLGPRGSGFTLVELLTVIAIVAVLASLLMTGIASAKRKSRAVVSTFNLRQISLALNMYMDDFGKRPPAVDELVTAKYLTEPRNLLCPEDKTRDWGRLVESGVIVFDAKTGLPFAWGPPATLKSPVSYSYLLHPLSWDETTWNRLMQESSSAGVAACQLHGLGKQDIPDVHSFEGLLLRAQRDGAVVRRQLFWNAPFLLDGPAAAGAANNVEVHFRDPYAFQIFLDDPAEWAQFQIRSWIPQP